MRAITVRMRFTCWQGAASEEEKTLKLQYYAGIWAFDRYLAIKDFAMRFFEK